MQTKATCMATQGAPTRCKGWPKGPKRSQKPTKKRNHNSKDTQRRATNSKTTYTYTNYAQTPDPLPYSGRLAMYIYICMCYVFTRMYTYIYICIYMYVKNTSNKKRKNCIYGDHYHFLLLILVNKWKIIVDYKSDLGFLGFLWFSISLFILIIYKGNHFGDLPPSSPRPLGSHVYVYI